MRQDCHKAGGERWAVSPGKAQVAFAIDRGGNVVSIELAGSSGDAALDQEAVAMVRTISLAVPVRFSR